jgi:glycosyltransferase involved in cell wall biosynthesis
VRTGGLVCVMPRSPAEWAQAHALWITADGWARAGRRRFGSAWMVSPDNVLGPDELSDRGEAAVFTRSRTGRRVIEPIVTFAKDVRRWRRARRFTASAPDVAIAPPELVWQHHDLFHRAGERIARRYAVPCVSYVHAPQVWEAARWGVSRPGWGHLLERVGERPQLQSSDLIACVSDEVAAELLRFGVEERRVLVSPMAVDPDQFDKTAERDQVRAELGYGDATVIGWTGSFRRFHGLEDSLRAFAAVHAERPNTHMLLVGDGVTREGIEREAVALGIGDAVQVTGAVSHDDVPRLVAAMDICLVTGKRGEGFHYSPLKMREYLVTGRPVVGPDVGEVSRVLRAQEAGDLYPLGDVAALANALRRLVDDPARRAALGANGRKWVLATGTWDVQLDAVVAALDALGARTGVSL